MSEIKLQALNVEIIEEAEHVTLAIVTGIAMPIGQGQAIPVPTDAYLVAMGKEAALKLAQTLLDAAENLPDAPKPSNLVVASSLAGVDDAVKSVEQFRAHG